MGFERGIVTPVGITGARDALVAQAGAGGERGMAATARRALFYEALLGAVRARAGELKAVAK